MMKKIAVFGAVSAALLSWSLPSQAGAVLDAVKSRGFVQCGVNTSAPGFASADSQGKWKGLDVNVCRAVAAAVLGDSEKVKYIPLNSPQRFTALQSGEIDILARNTTWNMTRDASQGSVFVAVSYYDGQGFLVPKSLGLKSARELDGATVCVQTGTSSEKTLSEYFSANGMELKTVVFDTTEATQSAFLSGRCDVYTTDMSDLAAPVCVRAIRRITKSFPKRSARSLWGPPFAAVTTSGSRSSAGPSPPCSAPKSSA